MAEDAVPMSREVWNYSMPAFLLWARQRGAEHDRWWSAFLLEQKQAERAKGPAS